jgi:tRNA (guanine37-N1)-methyltransferase
MRVEIFTIFPELVSGWAGASLIGKAWKSGAIEIVVHDLRAGANDAHRSVDDSPFGGGAGMVLAPEPVFNAVEAVSPVRPLFLLGPGGRRFDQALAHELAARPGFSLLCGRYEGVDERVAEHLVDAELSIGDYVLAGGEAAAIVVVEAVARLAPGAVGGTRGFAVGSSRTSGPVEEGGGAGPHAAAAAGSHCRPRGDFSRGTGPTGRMGLRCSNLVELWARPT